MRSVGLKILKNRLSAYVRLAQPETVLVTDRDRVVAEIVPPQVGRDAILADTLVADGVREGWLRPARKPVMTSVALDEELRHDREDR